jgi:hypothetical protein
MNINGRIVGSIAGAAQAGDVRTERSTGAQPVVPAPSTRDSIAISDVGRALSAQDTQIGDLDPHQESVIRKRIVDGAYDALEIVDQVARRILESGDL